MLGGIKGIKAFLPSRSLSNVSVVVQSVAGPVPFTVTADTLKEYSVPRSRAAQQTPALQIQSSGYLDRD